jgi:hypothetical protein
MAYSLSKGITGGLAGAGSGAAVGSVVPGIGTAAGAIGGGILGLAGGFGDDEKIKNISRLTPEQQEILGQLTGALKNPGAGGAFGDVADYYRGNLSNNPQDFNAFASPAFRQYNEDIMPGISEQFAGMGSGGLNSSGFRNAQIKGATDLSERLAGLRASLRQQSAAGLANLGQIGLGNYSENVRNQPQQGFGSAVGEGLGEAGAAAIPYLFDYAKGKSQVTPSTANSGVRNTSPYGNVGASALPNFNYKAR